MTLNTIVLWGITILILVSMFAAMSVERVLEERAGWITYDEANSGLAGNSINVIAFDTQGRAWAGTGSGVSVFDGEDWTTYNTGNSGLVDNHVRSIAFDAQGRAWIGTSRNGVSVFYGETWTTRSSSGMATNSVEAIAFDNQGRAWLATYTDGVNIFDGEGWTHYDKDNSGLPRGAVRSIAFDQEGRAWIGVYNGLRIFDEGHWLTFSVPGETVDAIAFDHQGRGWVGTSSGTFIGSFGTGVSVFDRAGNRNTYDENNSPLSRDALVLAITFDAEGRAWIGTHSRRKTTPGFHIFDGETWITYDTENSGLVDNHVRSIAFDGQGRAWIGTKSGISIAPESELASIPQPLRFLRIFFASGTKWLLPPLLGVLWLLVYLNANRALYSITMRSPMGPC